MYNKFCSLLTTFFVSASFFGRLYAQDPQFENQQIERLEIIVENGSNQTIVNNVKSRITVSEGGFFSQADFDSDLKHLAHEFDRVEPILTSINGKIHIVLKVWPRPQIRSIRWCGNNHVKTEDLRKELGVKPLATFDRQGFNKAFHKIKAYYVKNGFFEAQLSYETVVDSVTNEVDLTISINEGRLGHINKLNFCGFTKDEESDLLELVLTKTYSFLFSWYTGEGTYHEEMMQQDQFIILNYIQNQGFADAKVQIEVRETCNKRIDIYINLDRGELYTINEIEFTGNTLFCDDQIRREFTFRPGSPYSQEKVRETVGNISDLYGRKGYIDANVDFEPSLDMDCREYSIKMTIEEGEQYRVGMIKVFGNCTTQTSIILHESLLIPGEIFNIEKLKLTEQKLTNVGYFESVNVYAVKSEGPLGLGECYRDVHIEVKETSTGHFGAFFGYSTSESLFGGLNITERNFNIVGLGKLSREGWAALRGGGEYAHGSVQVGLKSRKYAISWAKPFFRDTQWTVGFDLERNNNRYISDDYEINSTSFILHATKKINEFVSFGWHYRLKNSDVDVEGHRPHDDDECDINDDSGKKKTKRNKKEKPQKKSPDSVKGWTQLQRDSHLAGLISASGFSCIYDSTDHPVTPRKGFKSRLELEFAGIAGDHRFFSAAYTNSYFLPLDKKSVIKYRADFRFLFPVFGTKPTTVPLDERLFLGGDSLVRGYKSYRLGPVYDDSDDPRGGVSEQFYSIELTRRLHPKIEVFTFLDGGFLSLDIAKIGVPYFSLGAGARVKVIESIPSLTFGYGIPINPRHSNQEKRFFISIGGQF